MRPQNRGQWGAAEDTEGGGVLRLNVGGIPGASRARAEPAGGDRRVPGAGVSLPCPGFCPPIPHSSAGTGLPEDILTRETFATTSIYRFDLKYMSPVKLLLV